MKKESKIKILLPILAVIIVTVLIFNRLLFKLKDQVDKVALPIQSKVYNVANRAISLKDIIFSYEDIIAENENLKKENMELKIQKERNQKILEENERLSKLLEMKENTIYKGSLKFARVSFSDISNLNNKIFIDLGKKDGIKVDVWGNIGSPNDVKGIISNGGFGVGLYRTEFLFMDRDSVPTEEEQFEAYKKVAETMKGKPVIIRTLDIGGDKAIPYLGLETEENPFLGFRAIRFCLKRRDIYEVQLRALLRASAFGDIKIMVPLVTGVDELRAVKVILEDIKRQLDKDGIAYNKDVKVGVMMETPAACMMADALAKEADFFSIGTNDLTGYTMAVDRGNAKVAYLYSTYNPAVLRAIKRIIECGKAEGIMVGMCGEAAADPKLIPLLLAFGLDEFSVSATSVLKTRKTISDCNIDECKALAEKVMKCVTEEEVLELLK